MSYRIWMLGGVWVFSRRRILEVRPDLLEVFRCNFLSICYRLRVVGPFHYARNDVSAYSAVRVVWEFARRTILKVRP